MSSDLKRGRWTWAAAALLAAACASGQGGQPAGVTTTVEPALMAQAPAGMTMKLVTRMEGASSFLAAAPADAVWRALKQAYVELGVPVTGIDSAARVLRTEGREVRQVGKKRVAELFECAGAYENLATTGRVSMDLESWLTPAEPGKTQLRVRALAVAQAATSSQRTNCASTGRLEQLIADRVLAHLATPGG